MFSLLAAIVIGFVYNWKISLVCLACVPLMVLSGAMQAKFQQGLSDNSNEAMKEANMLAGDSIINYRTVASFANED
jgi:ABC-type transport system involved in Fe-S cluster assembly fused permease/ATPase subunit